MNNYKIGRDYNGNKIVKISPVNGARGFSIQTLGNLYQTNRDGVGDYTPGEVAEYIRKHGTQAQRDIMSLDGLAVAAGDMLRILQTLDTWAANVHGYTPATVAMFRAVSSTIRRAKGEF